MKIRFQADWDFNERIIAGLLLREPVINIRRAPDAQLAGIPDLEVLARTAMDGRILVSHDVNTMPDHFARFTQEHSSPGVILAPQSMPIGDAIEELLFNLVLQRS